MCTLFRDCFLTALTAYHRGKGDYYRLGSDSSATIKTPHKVEALANKVVVQVAVGALHCLALTESGEVSC